MRNRRSGRNPPPTSPIGTEADGRRHVRFAIPCAQGRLRGRAEAILSRKRWSGLCLLEEAHCQLEALADSTSSRWRFRLSSGIRFRFSRSRCGCPVHTSAGRDPDLLVHSIAKGPHRGTCRRSALTSLGLRQFPRNAAHMRQGMGFEPTGSVAVFRAAQLPRLSRPYRAKVTVTSTPAPPPRLPFYRLLQKTATWQAFMTTIATDSTTYSAADDHPSTTWPLSSVRQRGTPCVQTLKPWSTTPLFSVFFQSREWVPSVSAPLACRHGGGA